MKNIINLLKYNFGRYHTGTSKILYIIGFSVLFINTFSILTRIPIISEIIALSNIALICTFLGLNFIGSIIRFVRQISKEKGKLLFTFPFKSYEFVIAKILEFTIIQGGIVLVGYIMSILSVDSISDLIKISSFSVAYGTIISYIITISLITIVLSYIKNVALSMVVVVIGGSILTGIFDKIIYSITNIFPYLYIKIGNFMEIDIIYFLLTLGSISFLVYLAIYHLEKKLDII